MGDAQVGAPCAQFEHKATDLCWKGLIHIWTLYKNRVVVVVVGREGGGVSQCTRSSELTGHFLPYPFQSFIQ